MRPWKSAFAAQFVCSWAGNQFSPLLLMYKDVEGYTAVTVNAFLGVYVLGLAPAFMVAGALSDRHGRRPVILAAILFALATSAVLALGVFGSVPIYLGRLLAVSRWARRWRSVQMPSVIDQHDGGGPQSQAPLS
jgi:MFS family permease